MAHRSLSENVRHIHMLSSQAIPAISHLLEQELGSAVVARQRQPLGGWVRREPISSSRACPATSDTKEPGRAGSVARPTNAPYCSLYDVESF